MEPQLPDPQVSILMPCWNAARSVERALGSVLDTRDVALQCVVVDDASTDDTAAIVAAIAARDPRVELVRSSDNMGASGARNLGLPHVRGEWLTFLDSDDRMLPGAIAALFRATAAPGVRAVVGQRIWSDGEQTWVSRAYDRPDIREPGRKSLVRNPGLMFYASGTGKLFHRSTIDGLRFEGRVLGDQPWTLRALLRAGDGIQVIDDTVYEWTRPGPGNEFTSITTAKQRSAAVAAEAVIVAIGAYRDVCAEADRLLPDEASRRVIRDGYFERLVNSDFAGPVTRALATRDAGMDRLFTALRDFLVAAPTETVARSNALIDRILRPPLMHWDQVPQPARAAYWAMADGALSRDKGVAGGSHGHRLTRPTLAVARRMPGRAGTFAARGLLKASRAHRS
jgi:hypothetical protein